MKELLKNLMNAENTASSKRFVTLVIALHFIIASFAVLFIAFYVIFYLPKGKIEPELLAMLKQVLEYDFYIILSGLGFITAVDFGRMLVERVKTQVAGDIAIKSPAETVKVDTIKVEQKSGSSIEPEPEPPQDG